MDLGRHIAAKAFGMGITEYKEIADVLKAEEYTIMPWLICPGVMPPPRLEQFESDNFKLTHIFFFCYG